MKIEPFKVPLLGVVYEREKIQYQGEKRGWMDVVFYIRGIDRQRTIYNEKVKATNRLFLLGIWDPQFHSIENPPYEWAFSGDKDQAEMFRHVLRNIVNNDERRRFVSQILKIIKEAGEQVGL